ncbi:MAG: DPP IV N-terminal domain-containing protein [Bacteroidales bacterium]|nr:DPP IV N-terminal domain-containing protein [Bacteroidales bacterium]
MFKKSILAAFVLLLVLPFSAMSQTKKSLTLDDLMWAGSNYWNIMPRNHFTAWWGNRLVETDVEEVKVMTDAKGRTLAQPQVLFTEDEVLSALDTAKWGKIYGLSSATFPKGDEPIAFLQTPTANFYYNWEEKSVTWSAPRAKGVSDRDFCQASRSEAYVKDYNLFVTTADGRTLQVSTDGTRELQYGRSVHRDEFGIYKGTFWSPKGNLLAFYRMDQSMVTDYPLVDINHRVAELAPEKYPMAGMTSHKVTVGIFNPATGKTVYLQAGDPTDRYFTNIAWSPDEKTVYMIELPRTQDKAELVAYDAETGARKAVLYTETNDRYVEPMTPIRFLPWDDTKFIYQTRRDGWNQIYLFDTTGKQLAQLTKGQFEVIDVLGFNTKTRSIIYRSNETSPITYNLWSVNVKSGRRTLLGNGEGNHNGTLSADGLYLVDRWSAPDVFRRVDLVNTDKATAVNLWQNGSPWTEYKVPEIEGGTIKAADDSTDLYYRIVKPVDFDPTKKYPAVVYVYGGPHAHNVDASWNYVSRPWEIYMAQLGYVVFVVDNRGSEYRGFAFESCTHRHLGDVEMQDQIKGVEFLKSLPYVDADRLGVHGWSFGGYMTTNLMCTYPDVFKVGVAGGPVIDWKFYEVMYGERYMDTPQENPEGYASSSLLPKAKNLKGRLQIIVGYNDPTCVLQHNLSFLRACEDAGTQPDYFVYPGAGHNMTGRDMVHLHERITRYFEDYLK